MRPKARSATRPPHDSWPPLDAAYDDEFGRIDADVYEAAGRLWPPAQRLAERDLRDGALGLRLLIKAAAVTTAMRARPSPITNLDAYLFTTYRRLVLAQVATSRRRAMVEATGKASPPPDATASTLERDILLDEIATRMDPWTREIFELRTLGYSFDEIARQRGQSGAAVLRNRFNESVKRLKARLNRDVHLARLERRMDAWCREALELRALGYTFDEVGRAMGESALVTERRLRATVQQLWSPVPTRFKGES